MTGLDRVHRFDADAGEVECDAGVSLHRLMEVLLPLGWFVPVTPGTRYVTVGGAIALIGALQLLCASEPAGDVARRVLAPVIAAGSMPLTIYTGQLVVLALWLGDPAAGYPPSIRSWTLLTGLVIGSLLFAMLWRRLVGQGPLEESMSRLTRVPARSA